MSQQAKPIIPWLGGKRRLIKHILPLFPEHTCYVEPFAGGAALLFAKPPSAAEVLNDINGELVNLYRVVQHHLDEFVRQFRWALTSRQMFEWTKQAVPDTLTDVQRAARFYYLQKLAFGGRVDGQTFGTATTAPPGLNLLRIEEELSAAHLRLARVLIECLPWDRVVERYDRPHTLFFADPPYWQTAGYGVDFGFDQYERLAQLMASMSGRMILTINDHPDIRRVFKAFDMQEATIRYTVAAADKRKASQELIIRSW